MGPCYASYQNIILCNTMNNFPAGGFAPGATNGMSQTPAASTLQGGGLPAESGNGQLPAQNSNSNQSDPHGIAASIQSMFQASYPNGILNGSDPQQQQQPPSGGNPGGFPTMGNNHNNNNNLGMLLGATGGGQPQTIVPALATGGTVQEALQNLLGGQFQQQQQPAPQPTMDLRLLLQNAGMLAPQQQQPSDQQQNFSNAGDGQQPSFLMGMQQQQQQQFFQQGGAASSLFPNQAQQQMNNTMNTAGGVINNNSSTTPNNFHGTSPMDSTGMSSLNPAIAALLNTANQRRMMPQQQPGPFSKMNDSLSAGVPTIGMAASSTSIHDPPLAEQSVAAAAPEQSDDEDSDKKTAAMNNKNPRKGKKKPKDMPRRPLSAYNLFFKDERIRMLEAQHGKLDDPSVFKPNKSKKKGNGGIGFAEMAKAISTKWKSIDEDTLAQYKDLAAKDQARYKKEMDAYHRRFIGTTASSAKESDDESDSEEAGGKKASTGKKKNNKKKTSSNIKEEDADGSDVSSDED